MTSLKRHVASLAAILPVVLLVSACEYNDDDEAGAQDARQTAVVYPAGTSGLTAETPPGTTDDDVITETVVIENGQLDRQEITFPAGEAVALILDNRDSEQYELRIENLTTVDEVVAGSLTTAELEAEEPGTYPAVLSLLQSPDEIARIEITFSER